MSKIVKDKIIGYLKENNIVKTKQIQNHFNLSLSTARRYLIQLENEGFIERSFGEIIYKKCNDNELTDLNIGSKLKSNIALKKELAFIASKFVNNNAPIFLDSGSSCYYLLDYLNKDLTIYTNSIFNASEATKKGFKNIHVIGGKIKPNTLAIVDFDIDFLKKMYFPISFIGVNAISNDERLTTPEEREGIAKKIICENSDLIIVICEEHKFYKKALYDFTPKDKQIVVITNAIKQPTFANNFLYVTDRSKKNGYK